jgi:hypothetical protein
MKMTPATWNRIALGWLFAEMAVAWGLVWIALS